MKNIIRITALSLVLAMLTITITGCADNSDFPTPEEANVSTILNPTDLNEINTNIVELDYIDLLHEQGIEVKSTLLYGYYGCYNGWYAFRIIHKYSANAESEPQTVTVGKTEFLYKDGPEIILYKDGEFVDLKTAYDKGYIDDNDLYDIKYYLDEVNSIEPQESEELSDKQILKIRKTYAKLEGWKIPAKDYKDQTGTHSPILSAYKSVDKNLTLVFLAWGRAMHPEDNTVIYENVSGYDTLMPLSGYGECMIYKNGKLYDFATAYETGVITRREFFKIMKTSLIILNSFSFRL